jgi:ATP-dependent RNA helicase DeaD
MEINTFADLDLSKEVTRALEKLDSPPPTSVQKQAIPVMMDGFNLIAKAPTGTGKTSHTAFRFSSTCTWIRRLYRI